MLPRNVSALCCAIAHIPSVAALRQRQQHELHAAVALAVDRAPGEDRKVGLGQLGDEDARSGDSAFGNQGTAHDLCAPGRQVRCRQI
ncbi:hypothetical protein B0G69_5912 [Paraburkholderia sp. RAU2J]|nr:hypothetical protein B0G69_5912 [Paraburkholderia sp. RAU2J]